METQKVWFVTGASKGLGLSLVKQLLGQGYKVAATSRKEEDLVKAVGQHDQFLAIATDLKSEQSVAEAVEKTINKFGAIDIVVNNAGYGLVGSLEELEEEEVRENFNVNVFGSLNVIRKVMPHLRAQRSGHIFNIASVGGYTGNFPGFGIYCATKFALAGLTESLSAESKSFGVHATVVYPGYFRTDFLSSGSFVGPKSPIADYKEVRETQNAHENDINGNQANDPEKGVAVLIEIANAENPPLHLFLGNDAYDLAYAKMEAVKQDLEDWKVLGTATAFAEEKA